MAYDMADDTGAVRSPARAPTSLMSPVPGKKSPNLWHRKRWEWHAHARSVTRHCGLLLQFDNAAELL